MKTVVRNVSLINQPGDANPSCHDPRQRGSARLNFLIFLVLLVALAYVGYQAIPVFYQASTLKVYMQDAVNAAAASNHPPEWVRQQIILNRDEYGIPPNALINASNNNRRVELRVQFSRPIPLLGYIYTYDFDYTARSRSFLFGSN